MNLHATLRLKDDQKLFPTVSGLESNDLKYSEFSQESVNQRVPVIFAIFSLWNKIFSCISDRISLVIFATMFLLQAMDSETT